MHQLELAWAAPDCVRAVLDSYVAMKARRLAAATLTADYRVRADWLCEVLGPFTPADEVTFVALERIAREARGVLKDVTLKKRFVLWRAAAKYAAQRGLLAHNQVADMPPDLVDDSVKGGRYYTLPEYRTFRLAVPPSRYRRLADLSFLTGMHTLDLYETERQHLEPDFVWEGSVVRGRWSRRNHKNQTRVTRKGTRHLKVPPCWIPMEPELRELALEWLDQPGEPTDRIVGPMNNVNRVFEAAAARAGLHRIRPNTDFRASHATLLMLRGWSYEYVRIVLGHVGEVRGEQVDGAIRAVTAKRPTTLSAHYLRPHAHPDHQHR